MTRASTTETGGLILFLVVVFVVFSRTRNHQTVPVASAPLRAFITVHRVGPSSLTGPVLDQRLMCAHCGRINPTCLVPT